MKEKKTRNLVHGSLIAAVYIVLIMVFRPISFGPIQFRIAEALCVLPYFTPAANTADTSKAIRPIVSTMCIR